MSKVKKYAINHFYLPSNFSNGVVNYINSVNENIEDKYTIYSKPYDMNKADFRLDVYKFISSVNKSYGDDIIIEAPESQASTLLVNRNENIHIRLHCPYHLYKKIIKEEPDEIRFSEEIRAINKAKAISSPSHGMLELLSEDINVDNVHVYKNPIKIRREYFKKIHEKDIDLILFSRFNNLKGNEYIDNVISLLPPCTNIYIVGKQEQKIILSEPYSNVRIIDHIEGDGKFEILSRAKVALSLSKFENCSMAILEALSVATPVVAWDVGGNGEIAEPGVIDLSPLGDVDFLVSKINDKIKSEVPFYKFIDACEKINEDFKNGIEHTERYVLKKTTEIYKGMDYRECHRKKEYIPREIKKSSNFKAMIPVSVAYLTATLSSIKEIHKLFSDLSFSVTVFYSGEYGSEMRDLISYDLSNNFDIETLAKLINKIKIDVLIIDASFPLHINEVYKLSQKVNKTVVYSDKSPLIGGGFIFDSMGFNCESDYYNRRIYSIVSLPIGLKNGCNNKALWVPNIQHRKQYEQNLLNYLISSQDKHVDILCRDQSECNYILDLLKTIKFYIDFSLKIIEQTNLDNYCEIHIISDMYCDYLIGCHANIYACENTMFSNKLTYNDYTGALTVDINNSISFLNTKIVSNIGLLGLDVIYKAIK